MTMQYFFTLLKKSFSFNIAEKKKENTNSVKATG